MQVQGDMVLLKRNEHRTGNCFRLSASSIWTDAKAGDFYFAETHIVDNGEMVLAIIRKCPPSVFGARKVNSEKRIVFPLPKSLQERVEKPRNRGGYRQKDLFGEVVK